MSEIKVTCRDCGKVFTIRFNPEDMRRWQAGELIQNAFPYLTAGERELLKTQICDECWEKMFK